MGSDISSSVYRQLSRKIQYSTESVSFNFPVFGSRTTGLSPRIAFR